MVDARDELDKGRLEGVRGAEVDAHAKSAAFVRGGGGPCYCDGPGCDVVVCIGADGHAGQVGGWGGALGEFLEARKLLARTRLGG